MILKRFSSAALATVLTCVFTLAMAVAKAADLSDSSSSLNAAARLTNFQAATVVIGQRDFSHIATNQGAGIAANTLHSLLGNPSVAPNAALYLGDNLNRRILGFLALPAVNDRNAAFVLGQPNFTSNHSGFAANQFEGPSTIVVYKKASFVDDSANSRILIWKTAPTSAQASADLVVGQPGFSGNANGCSSTSMLCPSPSRLVVENLLSQTGNRAIAY